MVPGFIPATSTQAWVKLQLVYMKPLAWNPFWRCKYIFKSSEKISYLQFESHLNRIERSPDNEDMEI